MTGPAPKKRVSKTGLGVRPGRKPFDRGSRAGRGVAFKHFGLGALTPTIPAPPRPAANDEMIGFSDRRLIDDRPCVAPELGRQSVKVRGRLRIGRWKRCLTQPEKNGVLGLDVDVLAETAARPRAPYRPNRSKTPRESPGRRSRLPARSGGSNGATGSRPRPTDRRDRIPPCWATGREFHRSRHAARSETRGDRRAPADRHNREARRRYDIDPARHAV